MGTNECLHLGYQAMNQLSKRRVVLNFKPIHLVDKVCEDEPKTEPWQYCWQQNSFKTVQHCTRELLSVVASSMSKRAQFILRQHPLDETCSLLYACRPLIKGNTSAYGCDNNIYSVDASASVTNFGSRQS